MMEGERKEEVEKTTERNVNPYLARKVETCVEEISNSVYLINDLL